MQSKGFYGKLSGRFPKCPRRRSEIKSNGSSGKVDSRSEEDAMCDSLTYDSCAVSVSPPSLRYTYTFGVRDSARVPVT